MYLLLVLSAALFASMFLFSQQYQRSQGDGMGAAILFQTIGGIISLTYMFVMSGFQVAFTRLSVLLAFMQAATNIGNFYCGLKVLGMANMSVYSIFLMLGGMLLPFSYGVIFANEGLSVSKVLSVLFVVGAIMLSFEKNPSSKKAYIYYIAIFVLNGLLGIYPKIHQSSMEHAVSSSSYMATVSMFGLLICLAFLIVKRKSIPRITLKDLGSICGNVFCGTSAELLSLIALSVVPASVQYPIITGGVMVFSALISLLRKEKLSGKTFIATGLALLSTILIVL